MMQKAETWSGAGARIKFLKVDGLEPGSALSPAEAERHAAFRLEKRRGEWLAGRLAAKALLAEAAGTSDLSVFEIGTDRLGRPDCARTLLTISHSGGWALAGMKTGSDFLGADIERIEERHPAWYGDYFHPSELPAPDPSEAARLWTIKEALLKALGLGLTADPLHIKAAGKIEFYGKVLERYAQMGSPEFSVETRPFPQGFWTAVAADKPAR